MFVARLLSFLIQAQIVNPTGTPGACSDCATSAFTAIGAAYATEGYYLQSDIIYQILATDFGLFAPMLYILAAFGGLIGVATGAPPRIYMWFFLGPPIYSWLIDNTHPTHGVNWKIADVAQDQRQVWKLSEAGLSNINHARYASFLAYSNKQPNEAAQVSTIFLWFDELVSSTMQALVAWTGVHYQGGRGGTDTNLAVRSGPEAEGKHYLLSNLKWGLVENITDARLHNVDVRDAFVTFMASECGDRFGEVLDQASVIAAQNTRGENLTTGMSIFVKGSGGTANHDLVTTNLGYQYVPTPQSLQRMLSAAQQGGGGAMAQADGSYLRFLSGALGGASSPVLNESISCQQYLALLTQAFRWEAGHIYHQLVSNVPPGLGPADIVYNLFYGWDIKIGRTPPNSTGMGGNPGQTLDESQSYFFLVDLILVHLYRNEMAIAPQAVDMRFAASTKAENFAKAYARTTGNRAKYAEVYTWALMMPHVQGILMFLLAAGYPFAAMMIVIPGMHRAVLTWAKFWLWVKMWDVGFAIVMVLERSVWAMLGNGSNFSRTSDLVTEMQSWGKVLVACPGSSQGQYVSCPVPQVVSADGVAYTIIFTPWGFPQAIPTSSTPQTWENMLNTLDRAMILAANLDLDLSNSYYIYIMAALYFAVPAVTGQVILGAQAGAASLATSALGSSAQEIGKSAGNSMSSEGVTQMHNNMASVSQAAHGKSLRQSGLGVAAIEYGNQGLRSEMGASALGTAASNQNLVKDQVAGSMNSQHSAMDVVATHKDIAAGGSRIAGALGGMGANSGSSMLARGIQSLAPGNAAVGNIANGVRAVGAFLGGGGAAVAGRGGSTSGGASNISANDTAGGLAAQPQSSMGAGSTGDGQGPGGNAAGPSQRAALPVSSSNGGGAPAGAAGGGANGGTPGAHTVGGPGGALQRAGNAAATGITSFADPARASGRNQAMQTALASQNISNGMIAGMNVGSFEQGQYGKGYGAAASRMAGAANFRAEQDSWGARNNYAAQISGQAVALGHFIGGMSAGSKPTGTPEAMALNNMLGSSAKNAANYVMPDHKGGFFDSAAGTTASLNRDFGSNRVMEAYHSTTPKQAAVMMGKAEATLVGAHAHGGGWSGGQIYANSNNGGNRIGGSGDSGRGSETVRAGIGALESGLGSVGLGSVMDDGTNRGAAINQSGSNPNASILSRIR